MFTGGRQLGCVAAERPGHPRHMDPCQPQDLVCSRGQGHGQRGDQGLGMDGASSGDVVGGLWSAGETPCSPGGLGRSAESGQAPVVAPKS